MLTQSHGMMLGHFFAEPEEKSAVMLMSRCLSHRHDGCDHRDQSEVFLRNVFKCFVLVPSGLPEVSQKSRVKELLRGRCVTIFTPTDPTLQT